MQASHQCQCAAPSRPHTSMWHRQAERQAATHTRTHTPLLRTPTTGPAAHCPLPDTPTLNDIFSRAALCSSDVNTALLNLSPLPSCITTEHGNTLKPVLSIFPQAPLPASWSAIESSEKGGKQLQSADLCLTPAFTSQSLSVTMPWHCNNWLPGLDLRFTVSGDDEHVWRRHLSDTLQFCTRNCPYNIVKL